MPKYAQKILFFFCRKCADWTGNPPVAPNEAAEPMWSPSPYDQRTMALFSTLSGVSIIFGLDREKRYFSDLCVTWAPKAPQEFQTCDDAARNYAH
jgi:hypothetical protein